MIDDTLAVIVVDYRSGATLRRCVKSLLERADVPTSVTIVDNSGESSSVKALGLLPANVRVIDSDRNLGFGPAANRGLGEVKERWVAFVNPDVMVPPGAFGAVLDYLQAHPDHAAAAPVLRGSDGALQPYSHGGEPTLPYLLRRAVSRTFGFSLHDWGRAASRDVDWVSGACLLARRDAFDRVGGFDERFFMYFEDVDWCHRCRDAGWRVAFVTTAWVCHDNVSVRGQDARRQYYRASLRRYYAKHYGWGAAALLEVALALAG